MKHINQMVFLLVLFVPCLSYAMLPPLHQAVKDGNLEQARQLLDEGADVDAALPTVLGRRTPLHLSAFCGHKAIVELLLKRGANPNATDWRDRTSLSFAVEDYKSVDIVNLLLGGGANPNLSDGCGYRPLVWALRQRSPSLSIVALLVNRGADVNVAANDGSTPLHWAVLNGSKFLVNLLLEKGADPSFADKNGATPLHWAAQKGYATAIFLLIEKGASVKVVDYDHRTPLDMAKSRNRTEAIELLECWNSLSKKRYEQMSAFLMTTHPNLGAGSPANVLPKELFQYIWEFVKSTIKEIGDFKDRTCVMQELHLFKSLLSTFINQK